MKICEYNINQSQAHKKAYISSKLAQMLSLNSSRQPFDGITEPKQIDLKSYKVRGQGKCPPITNLLVVGCSLALFIYVNTYFMVRISAVINGTVYLKQTQIFSCDGYYCDQVAYNFINYYSTYQKCNVGNCQNIICGSYDCNNIQSQSINNFYACQNKCSTPVSQTSVPSAVQISYILAICSAAFFGVGIVIGIFYGIISVICFKGQLTTLQKCGLLFTWVWPKLKYYAFRRRQRWQFFHFDLRCMVIVDMVINVSYAVTLGMYIYLDANEFWQTGPQIAAYYLLIWATVTRGSMVGEVTGPFFEANRQLHQFQQVSVYS